MVSHCKARLIWKVVEAAEGRNVGGNSRGGLLTRLGMCTLAFGSEASEQASERRGVVCATYIYESSLYEKMDARNTGVLQVPTGGRGRFEKLYCTWVEAILVFFSRRFEERTVGMDS